LFIKSYVENSTKHKELHNTPESEIAPCFTQLEIPKASWHSSAIRWKVRVEDIDRRKLLHSQDP
jgi:hypothetical protein